MEREDLVHWMKVVKSLSGPQIGGLRPGSKDYTIQMGGI